MRRMWLLRRMKVLKLDPSTIFEYYIKEIRPLTEQGVIVLNSSLTKGQERTLEKIQKVALKIILGQNYISYEVACYQFNITNLKERRAKLCENLAIKLFKSSRRDEFFTLANKNRHNLVRENICRTRRCYNAPHNYLNRLVNKNRTRIGRKWMFSGSVVTLLLVDYWGIAQFSVLCQNQSWHIGLLCYALYHLVVAINL